MTPMRAILVYVVNLLRVKHLYFYHMVEINPGGKYSPPLFPSFPFGPGIIARFRSATGIKLPFLTIPVDNGNHMSVP